MSEFHDRFAAALKSGDAAALAAFTDSEPDSRFQVYRNNVVKGAADTLGDAYPAVKRLVGDSFFQGMARAFWAVHPPAERTLTLFGAGFPDFIAGFEPAQTLVYLADVARLDRAWLEAHHAPDAAPLTVQDITDWPPDRLAACAPGLHPSVRLCASEFPAWAIWRTNREDAEVERISLDRRPETALVHRPQMEVRHRRLSPAEMVFLTCIGQGASFEAASGAVADQFPGAEPAPVFIALLKEGVFKGLD
jgi:hypothetical protein